MHFKLDFEGKEEIGVYICLTNNYMIDGESQSKKVMETIKEKVNFSIVETTIAGINTVGVLCVGNKRGLLLSNSCTDKEFNHIRNSLPENIRVVKSRDRLNALGNNILCSDYAAIVNPDFKDIDLVKEVLQVPVYVMPLGVMGVVGSYGVMNSRGLMVHPEMTQSELKELADLLSVNVIASTANHGQIAVGNGFVVNDFMCIGGPRTTSVEITVAEKVFGLSDKNLDEKILKEEILDY